MQQLIDAGEFRENSQSRDWAGLIVAQVLDLDANDKVDKSRIKQLLAGRIKEGALAVVSAPDKKRENRKWIKVGEWLQHTPAPLEKGAAVQGAAVEQQKCPTTTRPPIGAGWCGSATEVENEVGQDEAESRAADDPIEGWDDDQ
ncbi:MAG TPA: hypothetical protein VF463_19195 [Sphingobium sp.]